MENELMNYVRCNSTTSSFRCKFFVCDKEMLKNTPTLFNVKLQNVFVEELSITENIGFARAHRMGKRLTGKRTGSDVRLHDVLNIHVPGCVVRICCLHCSCYCICCHTSFTLHMTFVRRLTKCHIDDYGARHIVTATVKLPWLGHVMEAELCYFIHLQPV